MEKEKNVNSSVTDCGRTPLAEVLDQISCIACINCVLLSLYRWQWKKKWSSSSMPWPQTHSLESTNFILCGYTFKAVSSSNSLTCGIICLTSIASIVWDFSTACRRRRDLLFQFWLQIFRRRVGIFSLFFLCCVYFLLKFHVNFSSVFYSDYRDVVTSSKHRPFCFHNFVLHFHFLSQICNGQPEFLCALLL